MRWLYVVWACLLAFGMALVVSLLLLPFALIPRGRRERHAMLLGRFYTWFVLRCVFLARLDVRGQEHLPAGGYLVVANHRSWADVPLLALTTASAGIAKREIGWLPGIGLGGRIVGAIFFDRKNPDDRARVINEALFLTQHGARLHLFPEGTRSRTGKLSEKVHFRLIEAAAAAGVPIVPACVWGTERTMPVRPLTVVPGQAMGIEISPVLPRDNRSPEAYAQAVWARVAEMAAAHGADRAY